MNQEERCSYLQAVFANVAIAKTMGLELGYDESGSARIAMPRDARFDHGMGDTHGGVFATLLDSAGWFTVAAVTGRSALTTNLNVYMLQPAKRGGVIASGAVQWAGRRAAVAEMQLRSASGELLATGTASFALGDELST